MVVELSEQQIKDLVEVLNRTNFPGASAEQVVAIKQALTKPLREAKETEDTE